MISEPVLKRFGAMLIDQQRARVIVPPLRPGSGHWFGGGNLVEDSNGTLWLVGRYRNQGDSRTGLSAGERGLELAVFCSRDRGESFDKCLSLSKSDLNVADREVLSIEGTALQFSDRGVDLFVSTEKSGIPYPPGLESFLKPGTGVWTIDRLSAESVEGLAQAEVETVLASADPQFVHVKDPFLHRAGGRNFLLFCSHPFSWSSSNTGFVELDPAGRVIGEPCFDFFPRGFAWDVAMTRGTAVVPFSARGESVNLIFYDGGECLRNLDEHSAAVKRPRGYSCEELGGLAYFHGDEPSPPRRVSVSTPLFLSPHGTGCSRYVDVLETADGFYATWQQSQPDGSQPLVMNFVSSEQVAALALD